MWYLHSRFFTALILCCNICRIFCFEPICSLSSCRGDAYPFNRLYNSPYSIIDLANSANAERLALREGQEILGMKTGGVQKLLRCPKTTMETKRAVLARLLKREGCISIPQILSQPIIQPLLRYINDELAIYKDGVKSGRLNYDDFFGGINCRGTVSGYFGQRQDFWLPTSATVVRQALQEAVRALEPLLSEIVTLDGTLHELSCLIADPGAPRQNIHADTIQLPCPQYPTVSMAPLYTFFIALQDITDDMGHTVFLPRTHTAEVHALWNSPQKQKEQLLATRDVVRSQLTTGDVSIFDSRILHCGESNQSKQRRVLFYFTLSQQKEWPLLNGLHGSNSLRAEDRQRWTVRDFL